MRRAVHLDLQKFQQIFEKIQNDHAVLFSEAWRKIDSCKKPEAKKSRDTVPLRIA
jgi:hypothetical protein